MKPNKNQYLYLIALLLLSGTSCNKYLNQAPQTSLTDASFWKTTADLQTGCNYLYYSLPNYGGTPTEDFQSDIAYGGSPNPTSSGTRNAPVSDGSWQNNYILIFNANNILQKSTTVSGVDSVIQKFQGEARFFRAFAYYELVKRYGDVPYTDRIIGVDGDTLLYASRTNRETIIDSIYADLDFAAAHCPQPDVQPTADYGRITATAALAFKSRVALFEGTWDKFHGGGDANKHLQIAATAAKAVIDGHKYSLYTGQADSSYYYEFLYDGGLAGNPPFNPSARPEKNYTYATNKENILLSLYGVSVSSLIRNHAFTSTYFNRSNFCGTRAITDQYLFSDGLPEGKSGYDSTYKATSSLTEFRNRDPRFGMTFLNKTDFVGIGNYFLPTYFYSIRKFCTTGDVGQYGNACFNNYNAIRYAEVLLNYAEATFELSSSIDDADLNLTINALRQRAWGSQFSQSLMLTNAFVASNGLDMRTEIRRERSVELALEGFRYWDLLRWKTAETELPKPLLGPQFFAAENPSLSPPPTVNANGFSVLQSGVGANIRQFDPTRDYLFPIPTQQILLEKGKLTQNPKW